YLYERMLEAPTDELVTIRSMLLPHRQELAQRLWEVLSNETDPDRRFRAAVALAAYDATNRAQWEKYRGEVAQRLVRESPDLIRMWHSIFVAVRFDLWEAMGKILLDPDRPELERSQASSVLAIVGAERATVSWYRFVLDSEGTPYQVLLPLFLARPAEAAALLNEELDKRPKPSAAEKDKD